MKNIIIASGYGQSGNSCVRDFFKEFNCFYVMNPEFDILRFANGIFALEQTLINNNNILTADYQLKKFKKMIAYFYNNDYKNEFSGKLVEITDGYIKELVAETYLCYENCLHRHEYNELIESRKQQGKKNFIGKWLDRKSVYPKVVETYISKEFDGNEFIKITKKYLSNLMEALTIKKNICLVNAIHGMDIPKGMEYFNDCKIITCIRDPRDVYADFLLNVGKNNFLPIDSEQALKAFFKRVFKNYPVENRNILNIKFEDFVLNYNITKDKILDFIGLDSKEHSNPFKYFDPEKSKKNIGLWRKLGNNSIVNMIENEFNERLYDVD